MARKTRKNSKVEDDMNSTSTSSTSSTEDKAVKKKISPSPARKRTKKATTTGLEIMNEPMKLLENFVQTFQMEETHEITEKEGAAFWKTRYEELFNVRVPFTCIRSS